MSELTVLNEFKNPTLNKIGSEIIENYKGARDNLRKAQEQYNMAIIRRWRTGKIVQENYEEIIAECGTQREFAERIGITEAMLSNDLRGYRAALDEGVDDEADLLFLLQEKQIPASTRSWEKLPRLLNEPQSTRQKDNRPNDEKRLEELYAEVDEIKNRNAPEGGELAAKAEQVLDHLEQLKNHLSSTNPLSYKWKSRYYLDWVKSLGVDFITGNPADNLDPQHTTQKGWSGNIQEKVPDCFTIPITRQTHNKWESGESVPSKEEISDALIRTLSLFIITHFPEQ